MALQCVRHQQHYASLGACCERSNSSRRRFRKTTKTVASASTCRPRSRPRDEYNATNGHCQQRDETRPRGRLRLWREQDKEQDDFRIAVRKERDQTTGPLSSLASGTPFMLGPTSKVVGQEPPGDGIGGTISDTQSCGTGAMGSPTMPGVEGVLERIREMCGRAVPCFEQVFSRMPS